MCSNAWWIFGVAKTFRGKEFASGLGWRYPAGKAECRADLYEPILPYSIAN